MSVFQKKFAEARSAAEAGDPQAMIKVASLCVKGFPWAPAQDFDQAEYWSSKAHLVFGRALSSSTDHWEENPATANLLMEYQTLDGERMSILSGEHCEC